MITLTNVIDRARKCQVYADTAMYTNDGKYRFLTSDVIFELSDKRILHIKRGFVWDENSIPWLLQPLFPKSGKYAVAALVHDALYYKTETTRDFADKEFKIWMKALKIKSSQIWWRSFIVNVLGWTYWNKNINNPSIRCKNNRKLIKIYEKTTN